MVHLHNFRNHQSDAINLSAEVNRLCSDVHRSMGIKAKHGAGEWQSAIAESAQRLNQQADQ